jgi:hypothetical protein
MCKRIKVKREVRPELKTETARNVRNVFGGKRDEREGGGTVRISPPPSTMEEGSI